MYPPAYLLERKGIRPTVRSLSGERDSQGHRCQVSKLVVSYPVSVKRTNIEELPVEADKGRRLRRAKTNPIRPTKRVKSGVEAAFPKGDTHGMC